MKRFGRDKREVAMPPHGFLLQIELTVAFENATVGVFVIQVQHQRQQAGTAPGQTSGIGIGVIIQPTNRREDSFSGFLTGRSFAA